MFGTIISRQTRNFENFEETTYLHELPTKPFGKMDLFNVECRYLLVGLEQFPALTYHDVHVSVQVDE